MKVFVEKQVDALLEHGPDIVKATSALVIGSTVIIVLAFQAGLVAYAIAIWLTAVIGGLCYLRRELRPFGKGLLGAASITLSLLPAILFGAIFSSLG